MNKKITIILILNIIALILIINLLNTEIIINKEISDKKVGIEAEENTRYIIINCNIHDNEKGIYINKNSKVFIINSRVENNEEEGIDIREFTKVLIYGNVIKNNGESGIETESDGVKISIRKNTITNNQTQGVTVQYRNGIFGKVKIKNNKIENNKKFNLNCNNPNTPYKIKGFYNAVISRDEIKNVSNKCEK